MCMGGSWLVAGNALLSVGLFDFERVQAVLGAEVVRVAGDLLGDGFSAADSHAACRVFGAAVRGELSTIIAIRVAHRGGFLLISAPIQHTPRG
jgi:hypothetical protein